MLHVIGSCKMILKVTGSGSMVVAARPKAWPRHSLLVHLLPWLRHLLGDLEKIGFRVFGCVNHGRTRTNK